MFKMIVVWPSKNTNASAGSKRLPSLLQKWRRKRHRFVVQKTPRHAPALRLPPGDGRRAQVMGRAQGPVTRSRGQAPRDAGRRSSGFLFRFRRHHPGRKLRRWHGDGLGRRHMGTALARCRSTESSPRNRSRSFRHATKRATSNSACTERNSTAISRSSTSRPAAREAKATNGC